MREIGGFIELNEFNGTEYYNNLIALNNARNALVYLIKARNIKKIYIPYYLCDSIENVCRLNNYDFEYYFINKDFSPIFNKKLGKNEYIYIVNYFGQLSDEKIIQYKEQYKNIILDNVQAFFNQPFLGIDTIYSCRKFFGVPDGAYLSTNAKLMYELETDYSYNRMEHILGRFDQNQSGDNYKKFQDNESNLNDLPLKKMSKLTHNLLKQIDYKKVINTRNDNFIYLYENLQEINKLELNIINAPYSYPLYIDNGEKLREYLISRKIYVPILWPNVLKMNNTLEKDFALNILPIPCDQRYDINDMQYIVNVITEFLNNK